MVKRSAFDKRFDEIIDAAIDRADFWFVRPQGGLTESLKWGVVSFKNLLGESLFEFDTEKEAEAKCKELEESFGQT